ncbi:hypothetical protein GCM10010124_12430 [Pilimelia terevasa]|uniref:Probable inorganic carbon transporter subunit DabA n=1 Tax=Pilimelia terevasa TaxID=53372 RepID=A0A8J3BKK4_9ACTN|nr:DUF2309 domain-containing protein [Pilimelia terevasa]GGK21483.1 hypothetical protein GCM10010124_12430 [Pilimelia terevasa]
MTAAPAQPGTAAGPGEGVPALIARAARLLPAQAPLSAFVHHNTLHAFEDRPFEEAVEHAARLFGTEPYLAESAYAALLAEGRITPADLDAVVADAPAGPPAPPGGPTWRAYLRARLGTHLDIPRGAALDWLLAETPALAALPADLPPERARYLRAAAARRRPQAGADAVRHLLADLWTALRRAAPAGPAAPPPAARPRDLLLARTGHDTDTDTHPLLIRFAAAYLDQGVAYWAMPGREEGILAAFRSLYGRRGGPPEPWLRDLPAVLAAQAGWSAARTVAWALTALRVPEPAWGAAIEATLLSLRGWAGMVHHLEHAPHRAPVAAPPARLADHLAVQLTLDLLATRAAVRAHLGPAATVADLDLLDAGPPPARAARRELAYEAYRLAQLLPVDVDALCAPAPAAAWLRTVAAADEVLRRRLLHLAYERRHRVGVLDGLHAHGRYAAPLSRPPAFQVVFCIDEREESLRRHLEEHCPSVETFGYAGFFGVPMSYQGVDDVRPRPLCPVVLTPRHLVVEEARAPRAKRHRGGAARRGYDVGTRTLARGAALSLGLGLAHAVPWVGRTLFPRRFDRWLRRLDHPGGPPTRLDLHHRPAEDAGLRRGFTVAEMTDIVAAALRTTGLGAGPAPVVLLVGHGSASLNNPHEAAHDCGATGGGRGGPNARALAAMANDPEVRAALAARGTALPAHVWFVGAYHNTCDDSVTYYDEDLVPARTRPALRAAQAALAQACRLAAHERCRRFATAPPDLPVDRALAHVETHTVDLGQPRPEYGHATNAVCVVGRRWRTRGLYLDRRAFLVSYDPTADPGAEILAGLLAAVGPVCAGINLEYYFSHVDPVGYGCGTKLPHNITGLLGVMDGHASDLRTGLPWQMVEIHEPVRLLLVVEAAPAALAAVIAANPALDRLVRHRWIQLAAWQPDGDALSWYDGGRFAPHRPPAAPLPLAGRSVEVYTGRRDHLGCAHVLAGCPDAPAEVLR